MPVLAIAFAATTTLALAAEAAHEDHSDEETAVATVAWPTGESFLREYAETRHYMAGRPTAPQATADGRAVLFLRSGPRSFEQSLFEFDVATGATRELLAPDQLLKGAGEKLSAAERARLERQRITARGFTSFKVSDDGGRVLVALSGRLALVERATRAVLALAPGPGALDPQFSPDGAKIAYVRDHDLWALDLKTNRERRVTTGGTETVTHGLAEFVAQEEMDRTRGFWWSPDGKRIAYEEADHAQVERYTLANPAEPQREATSTFYPRAGRANARVRLGVVGAEGGATTWLRWDAERYPYLAAVVWPKKGPLTLLVQGRRQTEEALLAADPKTGATKPLVVENDVAWLNLARGFPRWLEDGSGFLWYTERPGGPAVELCDPDGEPVGVWVTPEAGMRSLVGFSDAERALYFTGSPDPTRSYLWRVRESGTPERLAALGDDVFQTATASKDAGLFVVRTSAGERMPVTSVWRADGARMGELPSVALEPVLVPKVEFRRVGPGDGFWSALVRPTLAAPGKKLPVVVQVYGGPGYTTVRHAMEELLLDQWLADRGFLVARFDGRGTPGRGRTFERAIQGDLATIPVADQAAALEALSREVPEMDLARVGVTGWSFGGFLAAMLVMQRPDLYRAAVAGAPVADWADYDTHYTERYLGTPAQNPKGFEKSSLVAWAPKLERPLLVVHGTADDNVWFSHALKLADALFRAGKPFELLPLSSLTHLVPDPVVTERLEERTARFFATHLAPGEKSSTQGQAAAE